MLSKPKRVCLKKNLGRQLCDFISNKKLKEVILLIADPNCNVNWVTRTYLYDWTPLIMASIEGYSGVVKALLKRRDLLINHQTLYGSTALKIAINRNKTICVKLIVEDPRTEVNLVDEDGYSVLWWAYYYSLTPIMKLLISHGANVEGVTQSVLGVKKKLRSKQSTEAIEVMNNWKLYLPKFTRYAKSNKYYPSEFKDCAFVFILCCLRTKVLYKDLIYLLLEYVVESWKTVLK